MEFIHKQLASGGWEKLTLVEQMANIGSEVHRSIISYQKKEMRNFQLAFDRTMELFYFTLKDPRWKGRRKEIARSKEIFCDLFYGNSYNTDPHSLDTYFMQFAIAV